MATRVIPLGPEDRVAKLYSWPNRLGTSESLPDTILHWTNQTLERDGLTDRKATASVTTDGDHHSLVLDGPDPLDGDFVRYSDRIPKFLENGWDALQLIADLETMKKDPPWPDWAKSANPADNWDPTAVWDPQGTGQWRFFMPLGMAMINHLSLQFFHYPPIRLLTTMQDYLDDPVPVRWIELLVANGVTAEPAAWLDSTVMDGAPVAAPDDQGTIYPPEGVKADPVHLIPIAHFNDYQRAQVALFLNTFPGNDAYTIPIVVYGTPARETFNALYGTDLDVTHNPAITHEIVPGKTTPIACSGHPYRFYAQAQDPVGSGSIIPGKYPDAVEIMKEDLAIARWQHLMSKDPTQNPEVVFGECQDYWFDGDRAATVCTLVRHEGSLLYPDPDSLEFTFKVSMEQAAEMCEKTDNDPCGTRVESTAATKAT